MPKLLCILLQANSCIWTPTVFVAPADLVQVQGQIFICYMLYMSEVHLAQQVQVRLQCFQILLQFYAQKVLR